MHLVRLGLVCAIIAITSPSAYAHAELISTNPVAGSNIDTAPENIMLTFSEAPILAGSYIQVEQPSADFVSESEATLDGTSLVIQWPTEILPGQVKVNWRAVSDDGHVANASFDFTYQQEPVLTSFETTTTDTKSTRNVAGLAAGIALIVLLFGIGVTTRRKK